MKRRTILSSILVIIACIAVISGTTFALFTSESSVNIAISSGKVNVVATLDNLECYSATANTDGLTDAEIADVAGTITSGPFAGKYYYDKLDGTTFTNNGKAKIDPNQLLKLERVTPGDKVKVNVNIANNSNVKIQYRIRVNVVEGEDAVKSLKLFSGLKTKIAGTEFSDVIRVTAWATIDENADITDVPVEIYLPLEAGNEYQDLSTQIKITVEAVQSNAHTASLDAINTILANSNAKNNTMYDAIQEVITADSSYVESDFYPYVWNVDTDRFYDESSVDGNFFYKYFKAYDEMPTAQTYSIYAKAGWNVAEVSGLKVGFDAGNSLGITSITYDRSTESYGRDVVIRTNSFETTLTVNAPLDVIHRYGTAGTVTINAIAGNSYHENGKVVLLKISKGRIALEENAEVEQIYISSKKELNEFNEVVSTNTFDEIVVAIAPAVTQPTFSRDDILIASTGTLVVELQSDTNNNENTESDYVWLFKQGVISQMVVTDEKADGIRKDEATGDYVSFVTENEEEIMKEVVVLGVSAKSDETKKVAVDIANNYSGNNTSGTMLVGTSTIDLPKLDINDDIEVVPGVATQDIAEQLGANKTVDDVIAATKQEVAQAVVQVSDDKKSEQLQTMDAEAIEEVVGSVESSGLTDEQIAEAVIEMVKTVKYKKFIEAGYSFVVGDTGYTSLKAAFDNVEDNQTITLIKDLDFTIEPTEVTNESMSYWFGSGYSNSSIKSYIHLHNKKGIVFDLNEFTMNVDYSFNFIDYFYPSGYTSDKAFLYLSGESSLKITNGTMNIKFDYKNRATTSTGSSVYNSGYTYAAIYVHNNPENPGKNNPNATYDIEYPTELSMINCSLKTNQIPLYLHHGARVTELNANLMYYCDTVDIVDFGKSEKIGSYNIQNNNYHCIYMKGGSKIDKITGGSYICCDQRELDDPNFPMQVQGSALYVTEGFRASATYYPQVYVPRAEVGEISGGVFKSNGQYPVEIKGYVEKISGGLFYRIEGTYAGRNTMYFNPTIIVSHPDDNAGIGCITGGTFIGGSNPNRPDGLNNIIAQRPKGGSGSMTYPSLANFLGEGYTAHLNESLSYDVTTSRTTDPIVISCYAYDVLEASE